MPKNETSWKKGQAGGGKGGRPKKENSITHWLKYYRDKQVPKNFKATWEVKGDFTYGQALAFVAYQNALQGDRAYSELIMKYIDGLPVQKVENTIDGGNLVLELKSDIMADKGYKE